MTTKNGIRLLIGALAIVGILMDSNITDPILGYLIVAVIVVLLVGLKV